MRKICAAIVIPGLMAVSLAACNAASKSAEPHSPLSTLASTTVPATTTTTVAVAPATTAPKATGTAAVGDQLGKVLVVPAGFAASTATDVTNGPVDAAAFDKQAGQAGAAALLGFAGGYDETYDQVSGNDYVEILLLQFATPVEATSFRTALLANKPAGSTTSNFAAIPGAIAVNGPHPDGTFDHGIAAVKGRRLMAIDYTGASAAQVAQLMSIAVNQYRSL